MFRFEHPEYLWVFAALPVLLSLYFFARWRGRHAMRSFATDRAAARLLGAWSERKALIRSLCLFTGLALLCMALANPQMGLRREKVTAKSADVFIALDISNSMYARDIAPSRLERAKKLCTDLIRGLRGERIGLILFAGSAYLQMPLTNDYAAGELFVRSAHPGLATTQGTAIGEAITLAMRAYIAEDARSHALILVTDGENHEEGAIEAMTRAHASGLIPFVIAVGTEEGAFIPMPVQGREDYLRDNTGTPVRSALNETFLRELAQAGGGTLYNIYDTEFVVKDIREKIDQFDKRETEQRAFTDFQSYFQYFLFGALLLLVISWSLGSRRTRIQQMHVS